MKILVTANDDRMALGWSYARAFMSLDHEVEILDPMLRLGQSLLWNSRVLRRAFERQILQRAGQRILSDFLALGDFDAIFIPKGAWSLPQFWHEYKAERPQTLLVCYNADDPITTWSRGANRPWVTEAIPCYDLYVTYNQALLEPLMKAGPGKVLLLPFAWDPEIHPMQEFNDSADVVFVGNPDAYREMWLTALVEHPLARDWRIKVYGKWDNVRSQRLKQAIQPNQKIGAEMARITAGARVSLNILREQNTGSHNMRTFETPGCGGVLASQFSVEQNAVFPNGTAAIYFNSPQDMVPTLAPYISDLDRLSLLREASRARVQSETYRDRARILIATIESMLP